MIVLERGVGGGVSAADMFHGGTCARVEWAPRESRASQIRKHFAWRLALQSWDFSLIGPLAVASSQDLYSTSVT